MADKPFPGASAPLGAIGRKLGFRWVFPIGTLPIPFHPLLFVLIPLAVAGTLLYWAADVGFAALDGRDAPHRWDDALWLMLALGVPLSVPLVQWFAYVMRLHLIQAVLALGAMALILLGVATGAEPLALAAVPACFFGWHASAALLGRRDLARLRREAAETEAAPPLGPADAAPIILLGWRTAETMRRLNLPMIYERVGTGGDTLRAVYRISAGDFETLRPMLEAMGGLTLFSTSKKGEERFIHLPAARPADAVEIGSRPMSMPFLKGYLSAVEARTGGRMVRAISGRLAPLHPIPTFTCFVHFSLVGNPHLQWQVGFQHARPQKIGVQDGGADLLAALFDPAPGDPPPRYAPLETVRGPIEALYAASLAEEITALEALLADPGGGGPPQGLTILLKSSGPYQHRGRELVAALGTARHAPRRPVGEVHLLAAMIALLPEAEFRVIGRDLLKLLNSREVSLSKRVAIPLADWRAGRPLPFGGFGLLNQVPQLYARLGELPEARVLVMTLGEESGWPDCLVAARARLDRGHRGA